MSSFTRTRLIDIRRRAMRCGVWFRVLSRVERAIVNLTIRVVDEAKSKLLVGTLKKIVDKLCEAMLSFRDLVSKIGRQLARRISDFLVNKLGYEEAREWAYDRGFWEYLTVITINQPRVLNP
ncbi:hypothetical protein DRN86_04710 [Candidatus Geothermarchaeota archaeon]|nr:MAG: hypothetical protein DRN86_04710 [Candidatus Geothermarchaeota archaeon]